MKKPTIKMHCFVRSGSMFMLKFTKFVCELKGIQLYGPGTGATNGYAFYDPKTNKYKKGCACPIGILPMSNESPRQGYWVEDEIRDDVFHVIQLRDPRDILVSQYYSHGWTHGYEPGHTEFLKRRKIIQSKTIDEYVKIPEYGADHLYDKYEPIFKTFNYDNIKHVKYNQMVLDFPSWVKQVVYPFDLTKDETQKVINTFKNEFINVKETKPETIFSGKARSNHKRKMYPGDFKNKFKPETIKYLNDKFTKILDLLRII